MILLYFFLFISYHYIIISKLEIVYYNQFIIIVWQSQGNMANKVSNNIRRIRQKKGISQDRLSKEADLALNTIVKIETGESPNPTVETLEKIAKALGVSVAELFKD